MKSKITDWVENYSEGPYDFYRNVYEATSCGPTVGFNLRWSEERITPLGPCAGEPYEHECEEWVWCDDLRRFGSWKDVRENDVAVIGIAVGSIVEGVDQCCDTHYFEECEDTGVTSKDFFDAVDSVNEEADGIWKETHGCERCSELANHVGLWGETTEGCDGMTHCHGDCDNPECMGQGIPI